MDQRQEHLVAAAEALRTWIHTQRGFWSETAYLELVGSPAPIAPISAPDLSLASIEDSASVETLDGSAMLPPSPFRAWPATVLGGLGSLLRTIAPFVSKVWREAAAIAVILSVAWFLAGQWATWSRGVQAGLAKSKSFITPRPSSGDAGVQPKPAEAPAKRSGTLDLRSTPDGAEVRIDGRSRGVTPLTLDDLAVGSHTLELQVANGTIRKSFVIAPDKTLQLNEAIFSGWLHVSSPIELKVAEKNEAIALDDSNQALLPPGPHEVRLTNRSLGFAEVHRVDIKPGATTSLVIAPSPSHLTLTSSLPADVTIDGEPAGPTPLTDHAIALGSRDITVRSTSGEVKHLTLSVTVKPLVIEVDFSKP